MEKVLFSPVGGTDPISNDRDGAMLHICRVYKPDVVYLYLSKEMINFHLQNNRYVYCIEKLGELLRHEFKVKLIMRGNLEEVQLFDPFIEEYRDILRDILREHEGCELYLNVSSGSPAMKSALQILGAVSEGKMKMIQVSTPEKKINPHKEDRENYDVDIYWECNDDNTDFKNRCVESRASSLLDEVRRQSIIRHVRAYDYAAALSEAKLLTDPLSERAQAYLEAAHCRTQLDMHGLREKLGEEKNEVLPVKNEKFCNIFEYILNLQIKVKREEYVDFIRGITPVLVDLFQIALKETGGIDYKDYTCISKRTVKRTGKNPSVAIAHKYVKETEYWDWNKVGENERLDRAFADAFGSNYKLRRSAVYSSNLLPCIREFSTNEEIVALSGELRDIEEDTRNIAAHEVVSVTRKWIQKRTGGHTPKNILDKLKRYVQILNMGVKKQYWNSYEKMNDTIIALVKRR